MRGRKSRFGLNREWLEQKYLEQNLSCSQIAKEVGCSRANISYYLKVLDIPQKIRNSSKSIEYKREQGRKWYHQHIEEERERSRVRGKEYRKTHRKEYLASQRKRRNNPIIKEQNREKRQRIRNMILDYYGGKCVCCGESNKGFLTLDHVNNDGHKQRKEGITHTRFHKWIIEHNFPNTIQILCYNCNCGRHFNGGICPHKQISHNDGIGTTTISTPGNGDWVTMYHSDSTPLNGEQYVEFISKN